MSTEWDGGTGRPGDEGTTGGAELRSSDPPGDAPFLSVENIHVFHGDVQALWGVSLEVHEGEVVSLLGSNGAGKTTTLRTISGLLRPRPGRICFAGREIHRMPAHEVVALGVAQIPEGRRLWPNMTVLENLELGAYPASARGQRVEQRERMFKLFPRLSERRNQVAGTLSGGEQQMLAIARGLMSRPKLLMLDEPSLGLAPLMVQEVFRALREVRDAGITVLLVEQNVSQALELADRGYVLETGRIVLQGPSRELLENPHVRGAYLGL
jgi:branched-chain amino acid transport system ATP-binding protein